MLLTQEKYFRKFWYPVIPYDFLKNGPQSFKLLGDELVLWLDKDQNPCAAMNRCAHRSARLSKGWVEEGNIVCPYHAWQYNREGHCVKATECRQVPKSYKIPAYKAKEKYGYVWVCLEDPLRDIEHFPEADSENYRLIPCFYETWNTMSLRVVENELDMAHFAVVHRGTFGNALEPLPLSLEIEDISDFSLNVRSEISVCVPPQQQKNTGVLLSSDQKTSTRLMNVTWYMPFMIKLSITYPSGLNHVIINCPTPIDDSHIQVVQFCFRNDTEKEVTRDDLIKFERQILNEDRAVLETTDYNYPILNEYKEVHMPTDKPGIMVRKKLKKQLSEFNLSIYA